MAKLENTEAEEGSAYQDSATTTSKRKTFRKPAINPDDQNNWGKPQLSTNSKKYNLNRPRSSSSIHADLFNDGVNK